MRRASMGQRWLVVGLLAAGCSKDDAAEPAGGDAARAAEAEGGAAGKAAAAEPDAPKHPAAEEVLAKAVEAIGGQAALDRIESFYYEGQIEILGQNVGGQAKLWWKNGEFYTEQQIEGVGLVRAGKHGDEVWAEDPINGLRTLEGKEAEQHTWASSLQLAADWKRYFTKAETVAERELDGKRVYDVELTATSGSTVKLTFDAESGLPVAQTFDQVSPLGAMPVTIAIEDYRDVDGVKIAFRQVTDAKLAKATLTLTKIDLNADVSSVRFAKPTSGADVVAKPPEEPEADDGVAG